MKNLEDEGLETMQMQVRSRKGWRMLFALVLVAALAALSAVGWTQLALADAGGVRGHAFDVTWTKWITSLGTPPCTTPFNMEGVVGGDVGAGTFAGEILCISTTPDGKTTNIEALYHINGSRHSFSANVFVTQDNVTGTGVITGGVTQGWLKGAPVTGEYTVMPVCPIPTPDNVFGTLCFRGTLHILRGFEH